MNADSTPAAGPGSPSSIRNTIRAVLLVVALGLAGLYVYAMSNPSGTIDVEVVNRTGEPLKDVVITSGEATPLGEIADGATAKVRVPLSASLALSFAGPDDGRRTAAYPYTHARGVNHHLLITLIKGDTGATQGRQVESKFSVLFGGEMAYTDPIDDMEMEYAPLEAGNSPVVPNRTLPPPSPVSPEAPDDPEPTRPETKPEAKSEAEPEPQPETSKAP